MTYISRRFASHRFVDAGTLAVIPQNVRLARFRTVVEPRSPKVLRVGLSCQEIRHVENTSGSVEGIAFDFAIVSLNRAEQYTARL